VFSKIITFRYCNFSVNRHNPYLKRIIEAAYFCDLNLDLLLFLYLNNRGVKIHKNKEVKNMNDKFSIENIIIAEPDSKPLINECSLSASELDAWHYGAKY